MFNDIKQHLYVIDDVILFEDTILDCTLTYNLHYLMIPNN